MSGTLTPVNATNSCVIKLVYPPKTAMLLSHSSIPSSSEASFCIFSITESILKSLRSLSKTTGKCPPAPKSSITGRSIDPSQPATRLLNTQITSPICNCSIDSLNGSQNLSNSCFPYIFFLLSLFIHCRISPCTIFDTKTPCVFRCHRMSFLLSAYANGVSTLVH